jgi:membrane dipeptidase
MPNKYELFAIALAFPLALGISLSARQAPADAALMAKAKAIHEKAITIDTHVDIGGADYATEKLDPGLPTNRKCDLPKMKAGGLDGVFLAAFVGQRPDLTATGFKPAYDQAIAGLDAVNRLAKMHPELCELGRSPADVERIAKTGKRVILTGVENGYPMGDDLANLKAFYDRGARYMTLVHGSHNQLADSSGPAEPMHNGLSALGKKTVVEMNRLGMMVDLSHASAKSFWDAVATSKAPIIESHSGCKALSPNGRNLDDDQLKALAKNGGVIQIVALASYLKAEPPERTAAIQALRTELGMGGRGGGGGRGAGGQGAGAQGAGGQRAAGQGAAGQGAGGQGARGNQPALTPEQQAEADKRRAAYTERMKEIDAKYPFQGATIKDFVDHIDYAVKVAGIEHVGVGTDFDGGGGVPGFNDHSEAFNVTVELVRRGYTEQQIVKIWGGNLLRVWREVEKQAGKR